MKLDCIRYLTPGKSNRKRLSHISSKNTVDFMTSIREIYSPQRLSMLSNTLHKLTPLMTPSLDTFIDRIYMLLKDEEEEK